MDDYIAALIDLHRGLPRQGPGDTAFSRQILAQLPPLRAEPNIVDLGCGSGAGALLLAEHFGVAVSAVDLAQPFLDDMMAEAHTRGLADRINPIACDFSYLPITPASVDLLWSEGAAYNLTFTGALKVWRPLLARQAVAVISEITWLTDQLPRELREYWDVAYPAIADEATNTARAHTAGFDVVGTHRLPAESWWNNYYNPLIKRVASISRPTATLQRAITELETEMSLFRQYSHCYGYTFYILTPRFGDS